MDQIKTSVLMAVYDGDEPPHLADALASLGRQTMPPDEIVLVEDGPLCEALRGVIEDFEASCPGLLNRVALPRNQGLVAALNRGIVACRGELVLRMDADDIAHEQRIARQVEWMDEHPETGVLGTAMCEFVDDPSTPLREKPVREFHADIRPQLPWRNPVNHPTVCIRRPLLADGYPDLAYLEDYFLWAKLMKAGIRFHNLPQALLHYRFDDATIGRRSGWLNFRNEVALRWWMYRHGLAGLPTFTAAALLQVLLRFAPRSLQRAMWSGSRRRLSAP